jgi:para-aminobenzoate synthetase/4-amino-4-deoxychorismate lyase
VGGGIVWDSVDKSEFEECATKALILGQPLPEFSLLETILWTRDHGYFLRDRHLNRLRHSAEYFGFALDAELVQGKLDKLEESFVQDNYKVRLTVDRSGYTKLQSEILSEAKDPAPVTVRLAPFPVSRDDVFLYHKTTRRHTYNAAMAAVPGFDDVVLWNEKGQVTETCICNIVVRKNGRMITPPIGCGLLAGTYRQWMLDQGMIEEAIVKCSDLTGSNEVFLINSVRGSRKASVHGA